MKRSTLLIATILVAGWSTTAVAQVAEEGLLPCRSLATERSWVTFGMVLGRIHVLHAQLGQNLTAENDNPELGVRESLAINADGDQAVVHYEIVTRDLELVVDFPAPDCVKITKTPRSKDGGVAVLLSQPKQGPIELVVGSGEQRRQFRADSFWHLAFEQRNLCDEHVLPILHALRLGWNLDRTADSIQHNMLRLAREQRLPDKKHWAALVKRLSSGTFRERRAAERELVESGQAVVAYLTGLDPRKLDAEQRERTRRIVRGLISRADDTPQRIALWLSGDEDLWLALTSHENPEVQQVAVAHLASLQGKTVEARPALRTAGRPDQPESR